jgi:hypothetical protein
LLRSKWASHKELEAERVALISELEKSAAEGKTAEKQKLGETRAAVFAELEESLSPELARQLETAIDRRLTFESCDHSRVPSGVPLPASGLSAASGLYTTGSQRAEGASP